MDNIEVHIDRCTAKEAFLSKDEAKRVRHHIVKQGGKKLGIYQCPYCRCWHFTKQKVCS